MSISTLSNRSDFRTSQRSPFADLSGDLLTKVFDSLREEDSDKHCLTSARLINHHWKLAVDQYLTQAQIREDFPLKKLMCFKYIQHLECYCEPPQGDLDRANLWGSSGTHLRNRHLLNLSHLHHLRHLSLEGHRLLTNQSLAIIGRLTQLATLTLHRCPKLDGGGLRHLANLHQLKSLNWTGGLRQKSFEREHLQPLAGLTYLHEVKISPIGCHQLKWLVELLRIKIDQIWALEIENDRAFSLLSKLPNLKELQIQSACLNKNVFSELRALTGLRSLDLSSLDVKEVGRRALTSLSNLKDLKIVDIDDGKFLNSMTQLTALTGSFSNPQPGCCTAITSLKNIKRLDLTLAPFTEECNWASLDQLRSLKVHFAIFNSKGVESIKSMTKLTSLDLSHSLFPSGFGFGFFGGLNQLEDLKCNAIKTFDALGLVQTPLVSIENTLPKLKNLGLRFSDIAVGNHQLIAGLPNLIELDLTGINYLPLFESYFKLVNPKLKIHPTDARQLGFHGSLMNENCFDCLCSLQNLEKLDLSGAFFRADDYLTLRTKRPDLKIYPNEIIDAIEQ